MKRSYIAYGFWCNIDCYIIALGYLIWRKTLVTFSRNQITRKHNTRMFLFDNIRLNSIHLYKRKFVIWGGVGEQIDIDVNWIKESNKLTSLFCIVMKVDRERYLSTLLHSLYSKGFIEISFIYDLLFAIIIIPISVLWLYTVILDGTLV